MVPVAEAGLRIIPQNQPIKSMHLNKLSRLAITLSLGTFVQVVSTPKIVQAQINPCVLEVSEQPNPPTSGQENPPVTDKPEKRVAASTHQQQDPSHIERSSVNGDNTILITTGNLIASPNSARSSAEGSIHLVNGNIHIDHLAPVDILDATTERCHLRKSAVGVSQKR